jgi:hypothetical protein
MTPEFFHALEASRTQAIADQDMPATRRLHTPGTNW